MGFTLGASVPQSPRVVWAEGCPQGAWFSWPNRLKSLRFADFSPLEVQIMRLRQKPLKARGFQMPRPSYAGPQQQKRRHAGSNCDRIMNVGSTIQARDREQFGDGIALPFEGRTKIEVIWAEKPCIITTGQSYAPFKGRTTMVTKISIAVAIALVAFLAAPSVSFAASKRGDSVQRGPYTPGIVTGTGRDFQSPQYYKRSKKTKKSSQSPAKS